MHPDLLTQRLQCGAKISQVNLLINHCIARNYCHIIHIIAKYMTIIFIPFTSCSLPEHRILIKNFEEPARA